MPWLGHVFSHFTVTLLVLATLAATAHAADFEIRRVKREKEGLLIYHDPVMVPGELSMRVDLSRGGCDVEKPPVSVRQAGDSFATLIAIDRGDKRSLGKHSKDILGGVSDYLRVELMTQRVAQDEYALLDSYGTPPPREQPLTNNLPALQGFLENAPEPEAAGAAIYRRTLDALRLLEATAKPLRAVVIISDGADPNLYPGGVAEDTLLIERAKQLGSPIFAIVISRTPQGNAHRAALQAAATRLQSVAIRSGGGVVREIKADESLRPNLAQSLQSFAQAVGAWQRTECDLCGECATGDTAVELTALSKDEVVARSRQPHTVQLTNVGDFEDCKQCMQASDCDCPEGVKATCKDRECRCAGECKDDDDCKENETCEKGKCKAKFPIPWLVVGLVLAFLLFVVIVIVAVGGFLLRTRAEDRRRQEDEDRRRRDEERWKQREVEEEQKRREVEERRREAEAQREIAMAAQRAQLEASQRAQAQAAVAATAPPTPFRLHAQSAGYSDIPLPEGVTVIGADQQAVLEAVRHLPPGTSGNPVVLAAQTISGKHAVVRVLGSAVSVTDLGSTNGTYVNGVRLAAHAIVELKPGDRLDLSRQVGFVVEATGVGR